MIKAKKEKKETGYVLIDGEKYMTFKNYPRNLIPHRLFIPAVNQTIKETGTHPDDFGTPEIRRIKELVGPNYANVNEDHLPVWARRARKRKTAGVIKSRNGHGPSLPKVLSEGLLAHYRTDGYALVKDERMAYHRGCCVSCGGKATEFHHHRYDHLDNPEEEKRDVVPVCRTCHKFMDRRREYKSGENCANEYLADLNGVTV